MFDGCFYGCFYVLCRTRAERGATWFQEGEPDVEGVEVGPGAEAGSGTFAAWESSTRWDFSLLSRYLSSPPFFSHFCLPFCTVFSFFLNFVPSPQRRAGATG